MYKKFFILMAAAIMIAGCNEEDRLKYEELQQELKQMQDAGAPEVPAPGSYTLVEADPFTVTLDKARYGVDAAGSVTLSYTLQEAAEVEVIARNGWTAVVNPSGNTAGTITVTAPDPAYPSDIVFKATAADGRTTAAMLPVMVRDPYTASTRTDIPALAYYALNTELATDYHFQMMADAGFNMLTIEQVDNWQTQLSLAHKYGMKGVLFVNGVAGKYYHSHGESTEIDDCINEAKNYPALAGYQIFDEPSTINIGQIVWEKNKIEELDPNPEHPVYVNLHPASASKYSLGVESYFDYVEQFVTDCNLKFITFDQYPIFDTGVDPSWHRSLKAVFDSSRKHGIQFWAFTLCCREWYREDPTLENIRLQCNTNLAYGAQVNQFFVYRCTSGTDYAPLQTWGWADESHQGKIYYGPNDVKYTDAYYVCKDYNREMHNFGFVFKDSYVQKVLNTNVLNGWLECFTNADLPPQMKSITTEDETLFSFVENNGNQYIAVINAAWHGTRTVKVEVNDLVFAIDHDGTFTPLEPGKEYDIALGGGDMVVFKYN